MNKSRYILITLVALLSATGVWALDNVPYIAADGTSKTANNVTEITDKPSNETTELSAGWYVVLGADVKTGNLKCCGNVHLILADGAKLTAERTDQSYAGIGVTDDASLTIYGQSAQTGHLIAIGNGVAAGIGGSSNEDGSNITINGGVIEASSKRFGAGIGGADGKMGFNITINRGTVKADGGDKAAGIGGGRGAGNAQNIIINGGNVKASGGPGNTTGPGGSGIGAGSSGTASQIYVNSLLTLKADDNPTPTTIIDHSTRVEISAALAGKRYTTIASDPYWKDPVPYIDADGITQNARIYEDIEYIKGTYTNLSSGWYVVSAANVQTGTLVCEGEVHLILKDGAKLTATSVNVNNAGILVSAEGASLTIYGQQNQTGQLIAYGGNYGAGIGGRYQGPGHDITINGGVIMASGYSGIGGGYTGESSNIFVNASLALYADDNNPPTTIIGHSSSNDLSEVLKGKSYVLVRKSASGVTVTFNKQGGSGGTDQVPVDEGSAMPPITVPVRVGYVFYGYYAGQNGSGIKYYKADGTGTQLWDLVENTTLYAYWRLPVPYIDADGTTRYAGACEEIISTDEKSTTLYSGWYIVSGADVRTRTLVCEGAVHLILEDGAKLTADGYDGDAGIRVSAENASLTIYGQQNQTGQLIAISAPNDAAGIGGNGITGDGHDITINGGVITAIGRNAGAGIGGGTQGVGYNITVNRGVVTAISQNSGAGIGGGVLAPGHDIIINGGTVTASGENGGSGIGNGKLIEGEFDTFTSEKIFVNPALILKADGNAVPVTEIEHSSSEDVASKLDGKTYTTLALPTVAVNKVPDMGANFGTFYHRYADYTVPNGDAAIYTASVETVNDEPCLLLHKIEGNVIPANTAVILCTYESSVIELQPCADASGVVIPFNNLSGANLPMDPPANCHILSYGQKGLGFYKLKPGTLLSAHKAYLIGSATANPTAMTLEFEGNATGNNETDDKAKNDSLNQNQE